MILFILGQCIDEKSILLSDCTRPNVSRRYATKRSSSHLKHHSEICWEELNAVGWISEVGLGPTFKTELAWTPSRGTNHSKPTFGKTPFCLCEEVVRDNVSSEKYGKMWHYLYTGTVTEAALPVTIATWCIWNTGDIVLPMATVSPVKFH